jgi:hypothetical protein
MHAPLFFPGQTGYFFFETDNFRSGIFEALCQANDA